VAASVEIFRQPGYWRERARAYRVLIDGEEVGRIRQGRRVEFAVQAGSHAVELRLDWCRSSVQTISIGDGDTAKLVCHPVGSSWTAPWDVIFRRAQYIVLRAEDTAQPPLAPHRRMAVLLVLIAVVVGLLAVFRVTLALTWGDHRHPTSARRQRSSMEKPVPGPPRQTTPSVPRSASCRKTPPIPI
jgi:hypothetical protein